MDNKELKFDRALTPYTTKLFINVYDDGELGITLTPELVPEADIVLTSPEVQQLIDFLKIHYPEMMR